MVTVSKENNLLKIETVEKTYYYNAGWCTIDFTDTTVIITDEGKSTAGESISIAFTEFQDENLTPYTTQSTIATYLSDKIG